MNAYWFQYKQYFNINHCSVSPSTASIIISTSFKIFFLFFIFICLLVGFRGEKKKEKFFWKAGQVKTKSWTDWLLKRLPLNLPHDYYTFTLFSIPDGRGLVSRPERVSHHLHSADTFASCRECYLTCECLLMSIFIVLKKGEGKPSRCSSLFSEVVLQ